jgi:Uma2 family endonuclease
MSTTTRITLDQYDEMIRRGDFVPREEHRVELLYGEITPMSPINPPHNDAVDELTEWSFEILPRGAVRVRVQGSFGIPLLDSAPEPDLAWLRRKDYSTQRPEPGDVLLVIEVADSSLARDRGLKAGLYAAAGIADYWIVNVPERVTEVRRDPSDGAYQSLEVLRPGQEARPLAFPDAALPVARIFPQER